MTVQSVPRDRWHQQDLPVLRAVVEILDERPHEQGVNANQVRGRTKLTDNAVRQSLATLAYHSNPPYLKGLNGGYIFVPTERALREVGYWPTAESVAERIVAALESIASNLAEPEEKRTWARRTLDELKRGGQAAWPQLIAQVLMLPLST